LNVRILLITSLSFICTICSFGQTLNVHVTGIRNNSGNIRLAFYNTSPAFDNEKPLFVKTLSKSNLSQNALKISYSDLKPGVYGIAILDDENKNEKMDYGLFLPKEGFGFSDYYLTGVKRPKFESFDFVLKNEIKTVEIKVRYL
jgi:uncharacterized protein (DUF2141 family)